jgi:DNA polymerase III delta prime subunit
MKKEHYLWTEIYRPQTIEECILPDRIKDNFRQMVKEGEVPNMLLTGTAGVGKTTVARALCAEIGADVDFINASKDGNIDTLRNRITDFASTLSLEGNLKVVILDEADYLNMQSTQPALRSFLETNSKTTRFILTANHPNRIMEPLRSRMNVIDFGLTKEDKPQLATQMMKRLVGILNEREIPFEKKALGDLIIKNLPDFRKIMSEVQSHSRAMGKIDSSVLFSISNEDVDTLIKILKDPTRFKELRKWIAAHQDYDFVQLLSSIKEKVYDNVADAQSYFQATEVFEDSNKYYTQVADMEIHMLYMLMMLMNLDWK